MQAKRMSFKKAARACAQTLCPAMSALVFLYLSCYVLAAAYFKVPMQFFDERSYLLSDHQGVLLAYSLSDDGRLKLFTDYENLDPLYVKFLILNEDKRLGFHPGFDVIAALRALYGNITGTLPYSGASTLAMQIARMLDPKPRTLKSKLIEMAQAWHLTARFPPKKLIEIYAAIAPMGGYLHGLKAASLRYFGHEAKTLSPAEAAYLTALPRSPEKLRADKQDNQKRALRYRNSVLYSAFKQGLIKEDVYVKSLSEPLPGSLIPIRQRAYHLGHSIFKKARAAGILAKEFVSPLNLRAQEHLNAVLASFAQEHPGIVARGLIIDDLSRTLAAYLGSSDPKIFLDLNLRERSPGSALKPFLYAHSFEEGIIHPQTVLYDQAMMAGLYSAANYDQNFTGQVSAAQALVRSLNLPALDLMSRLGPRAVTERLNLGHLRVRLPPFAKPSLPVILGGCAVSPYQLSLLYSGLNNDGTIFEPEAFSYEEGGKSARLSLDLKERGCAQKLYEDKSARAVFEILKRSARPQGYLSYEISYKTGTASRYTDAVIAGSYDNLTALIWASRLDNKSLGRHSAHDLLAKYFFALLSWAERMPYPKPKLEAEGPLSLQVPPALKRLQLGSVPMLEDKLKILYPQNREIVYISSGLLQLKAQGGEPPYRLYDRGLLKGESRDGHFDIEHLEDGFYRFTVEDKNYRKAEVLVRLVSSPDAVNP